MFEKGNVFINLEEHVKYIAVAPHKVYSESGRNVMSYKIPRDTMMMLRIM